MTIRNTESEAETLRPVKALDALPDAQMKVLSAIATRERFAAGQQLYNEGEGGTDFMFVGAGTVEARRQTPFGEQRVATLGTGHLIGEISLLDGKPRASSIIALGDGFVWRFDSDRFAATLNGNPTLELAVLRMFCHSLADKIRQANRVMTQIMAPDATATLNPLQGATGTAGEVDEETKRALLEEQGMATEEMQRLATFVSAQRFASGDTIFSEGDPGDTLFIIADGKVRISRTIPSLGAEALAILDRGEVFGEMAWLDQSPRSADAIAHIGGCTVLAIGREQLDHSVRAGTTSSAKFLRTLGKILCRRLRNMNDQLVAYRTMAWF